MKATTNCYCKSDFLWSYATRKICKKIDFENYMHRKNECFTIWYREIYRSKTYDFTENNSNLKSNLHQWQICRAYNMQFSFCCSSCKLNVWVCHSVNNGYVTTSVTTWSLIPISSVWHGVMIHAVNCWVYAVAATTHLHSSLSAMYCAQQVWKMHHRHHRQRMSA